MLTARAVLHAMRRLLPVQSLEEKQITLKLEKWQEDVFSRTESAGKPMGFYRQEEKKGTHPKDDCKKS
eukprot:11410545-Karenia_brevis.AAC.1